jgi:2'-5' RNA ligase
MKAAIALLADFPTQNIARRMVYEITRHAPIRFLGSLLPAHVSLKQPFTFEDMDALEHWFSHFTGNIQPFRIELDRVYYTEWEGYAIVGLHVRETPALRQLHNRINQELSYVVNNPSAAHDGADYEFHLTIELGPTGSGNPYKEFYEALPEKQLDLSFLAEYLALFFYLEPIEAALFNCYKVLPLGAAQ